MTLRQRHAEQTRQALLSAAARVFARRGYDKATIDEVATEAGASKGAVYHHFASKQELFRALLADRAAGLDTLRTLPDRVTTLPLLVTALVDTWFDRMCDDPEAFLLALESRLQALRDPAAANLLASYYRQLRGALGDLLHDAAHRFGYAAPQPHTPLIVFSLLDGAAQQWAIDPDAPDLHELRAVLARTVTDLLGWASTSDGHTAALSPFTAR